MRILIPLMLLILTPAVAQTGSATAQQEVVVSGQGFIIDGDEAKASDDALADALRSAVEQVVGTLVQSATLVNNYQVVEDRIYSQTSGYVQSYQIVRESRRGEDLWETTIRAVVKSANLRDDLQAAGILLQQKNKPRLVVLIDETNINQRRFLNVLRTGTVETELTRQLLEGGFSFVDRRTALRNIRKEAAMAAIRGDQKTARAIAEESGAEVLIVGTAVSQTADNPARAVQDAGMISSQATVSLRAIRADDGTVLAALNHQAAAAHIDQVTGGTQALRNAAQMAAADLQEKLLTAWQQDVYSGTHIQLRVLDVPSYQDLLRFKSLLSSQIRGLQAIYQREFNRGTAVLDMDLRGNARQVAEELALKNFSPYRISVVNVSANAVVIRLSYP